MPEKDVFRAYLSDEYPSDFPYQEIRPYVFSIPTQQAYEDLKTFQYILDTAYSGREYWEKQNNSFSEAYARVSRWIAGNGESVLISEFLTTLHDSFSFIHDGHLAITSAEGGSVSFAHTYKAFFADLLLEEAVDTCAVVTSAVPELPPGSQIPKRDIAECLFPTLAPPGKTRYYLGKRFWTASEADFRGKELTLPMEQGPLRLPLHPCRAARSGPDSGVFSAFEAEGIPIIRSSRFWEGEEVYSESLARQFEKLGQNLRDKPSMIWDIHDNHGGDSDYPQHFLRGLNGNAQWPIHCAVLSSPAVLLAKGRHAGEGDKRFWTFYPSAPRQRDGGTYPGTMYLLTSEEVGSSAEAAVSMAMNLPNCVRIGESTGGRGVFGEVLHYELPHSRLVCCVPHKLYLSGAEEGIGYAPHFWLDTPDLCCETLRWLRNPETYQAPIAASARNPESV